MPLVDAISVRNRLEDAAREAVARKTEGLRLYRPRPEMVPFHSSAAMERVVKGGNRSGKTTAACAEAAAACLHQPITTLEGEVLPLRYPKPPMMVWCHDPLTEVLTDEGWKPWPDISGTERLATVNLQKDLLEFQVPTEVTCRHYRGSMIHINGSQRLDVMVTPNHRMVVYPSKTDLRYTSEQDTIIREAGDLHRHDRIKLTVANWRGVMPELPDFLAGISPEDFAEWMGFYVAEGCCSNTKTTGGTCHWNVVVTQVKDWGVAYAKTLMDKMPFHWRRARRDFVICSKALWQYLAPIGNCYTKRVPQWVKDAPQHVIEAFLTGYFMGDGSTRADGYIVASSACKGLADDIQELLLRTGRSAAIYPRPAGPYEFRKENRKGMRREHYLISVLTKDRGSLRRLNPETGKSEFIASPVPDYDGDVYCATVPNGTLVTRRNGRVVISGNSIGYDEKHIARMYRKLCEPGLYKIIQDKATGEWRSWRPWEPDDAARKKETRRSAPLIPARMIETIAWVNKAEQVPSVITLKNGTRIFFFTSGGEAGVGEAIDLIWIDEDIKFESHVQEWQARLADNEGRLIWSSWPKGSNMALRLMVKRAEEQANRPDPDVQCWTMKFSANPFIPAASKQKILAAWSSSGQEALLARDLGEFADGLQLVFPTFDIEKHGIPLKGDPDPVERAVMGAIDHIPEGWTYYLTLDPGFAHIAATFGMVPPPTLGDVIVIRRSWYWARVDHYTVARTVKEEFPDVPWHAFIIDSHAGRIHTTGRGERVMDLFSEAFLSEGLESAITGCGFIGGSDDVAARNMIVRKMLNSNTKHGRPRFRVWSEDTYSMQQEFVSYKCRIGKTDTEDILARDNHSMDCNGYLAAYLNPLFAVGEAWQAPPRAPVKDPLAKIMAKLEGRSQRSQGAPSFYLGAGTAPTTGATV